MNDSEENCQNVEMLLDFSDTQNDINDVAFGLDKTESVDSLELLAYGLHSDSEKCISDVSEVFDCETDGLNGDANSDVCDISEDEENKQTSVPNMEQSSSILDHLESELEEGELEDDEEDNLAAVSTDDLSKATDDTFSSKTVDIGASVVNKPASDRRHKHLDISSRNRREYDLEKRRRNQLSSSEGEDGDQSVYMMGASPQRHFYSDRKYERQKKRRVDTRFVEICRKFLRGKCDKGEDCPYLHKCGPRMINVMCRYYLSDTCSKRDLCVYMHKSFPCKFFHLGASCYTDALCKFSHSLPLSSSSRKLLVKHITTAGDDVLFGFPHMSKDQVESQIDAAIEARKQNQKDVFTFENIEISRKRHLVKSVLDAKDGNSHSSRYRSPERVRIRPDTVDSDKAKRRSRSGTPHHSGSDTSIRRYRRRNIPDRPLHINRPNVVRDDDQQGDNSMTDRTDSRRRSRSTDRCHRSRRRWRSRDRRPYNRDSSGCPPRNLDSSRRHIRHSRSPNRLSRRDRRPRKTLLGLAPNSRIVGDESKDDQITSLSAVSSKSDAIELLPERQRDLYLRIHNHQQKQQTVEQKPNEQSDCTQEITPQPSDEENENVADDNWYSSDEESNPRLTDIIQNIDSNNKNSHEGDSEATGTMCETVSQLMSTLRKSAQPKSSSTKHKRPALLETPPESSKIGRFGTKDIPIAQTIYQPIVSNQVPLEPRHMTVACSQSVCPVTNSFIKPTAPPVGMLPQFSFMRPQSLPVPILPNNLCSTFPVISPFLLRPVGHSLRPRFSCDSVYDNQVLNIDSSLVTNVTPKSQLNSCIDNKEYEHIVTPEIETSTWIPDTSVPGTIFQPNMDPRLQRARDDPVTANNNSSIQTNQNNSDPRIQSQHNHNLKRDPRLESKSNMGNKGPTEILFDSGIEMSCESSRTQQDIWQLPTLNSQSLSEELLFKPVNIQPCVEIDASLNVHSPIPWSLIRIHVDLCEYSQMNIKCSEISIQNDPRLRSHSAKRFDI